MLKVFQRMGYFPVTKLIPEAVVKYIREQITFIKISTEFEYEHDSSFNRHRRRIYEYLKIERYDKEIRSHAIKVAYDASRIMNFPADIINVVIEDLRKNKFELPAFNQLSRLVKHARFMVNNKIFEKYFSAIKSESNRNVR